MIDAFEIFSGLVIFSEDKFEDKIKFLFDMFDLNEETKITLIELEFMLNTVITSIFKILRSSENVKDEEI